MAPSDGTKKSLPPHCWILSDNSNPELLLQWRGLRHFTLLGANLIFYGLLRQTHPPQYVKAFIRSQKNDSNDALAICETALRPGIHFVSVKTTEQQDIKALRNTRQLMVEQRTALGNHLRSSFAEYGFTIPVGILRLQQQLSALIEYASNNLTFTLRRLLSSLQEDMGNGANLLI